MLHEFVGYNLSEHQLLSLIRHFRIDQKNYPSLPKEDMFALIQSELKRINFVNFEALLKALEEKENSQVKDEKKEKNGLLAKEPLRLTLVATCGAARSQLRTQNLNHLFEKLMKW